MKDADKCISCKSAQIAIKKWRRCLSCYQSYYRKTLRAQKLQPLQHLSEMDFVRIYFTHNNWKHHPASFNVNSTQYHPDFYDGETNTFIEVVGTSQAFYQNRDKYRLFIKIFPKINFEIRLRDGQLVDVEDPHITTMQNGKE